MRVNLLEVYSVHELALKTYRDLAKRKIERNREVDAYLKVREISGRKKWNVRFGGYRW
ncbi:hypothetical protein KCK31_000342 [Clostridium perfringens]|uniref:hypothetical protein n=1 Tax=Clostridium perfringens TaxID=1502 RepID=UPI0013E3319C|nr:hypothetical protein [Clostridium perfringens]EHK2354932.1 hypothetical protein [Clostridium perfringens]